MCLGEGGGEFICFNKAFDVVSQNMLLGKMSRSSLNKPVSCWVRNWLMGQAQRVRVNDVGSGRQPFTKVVPRGKI